MSLLTRDPSLRGRFVFIQAAAPTRSKLSSYANLQSEAQALAVAINARHGDADWSPVRLIVRHHEPDEVFKLFRAADVCIVGSLHDGMNLVAKEFVASREDDTGVLVLSSFTGASRELAEALIVNPYDPAEMASTIAAGAADAGRRAGRTYEADATAGSREQRLPLGRQNADRCRQRSQATAHSVAGLLQEGSISPSVQHEVSGLLPHGISNRSECCNDRDAGKSSNRVLKK